MKRSRTISILVAIGVVVVVGLGLLIVPYAMQPGAASAPSAALAAYREAGTATVRILEPADGKGARLVDGTVRRSTRGSDADGRFTRIDFTDLYRNVRVRSTGGTTYTKNFDTGGTTPWVRLQTDGGDDASVALRLADPQRLLAIARDHRAHTRSKRLGLFAMEYETSCHDCGSEPPPGSGESVGGLDASADSSAPAPTLTVTFDLDAYGRPTMVAALVGSGSTVTETRLDISGYGAPVAVRAPAGATPSPTPVHH